MWNMKFFVIPVVNGTTGIVSEGLKGFTIDSRGEVPGKRKPVIREQHNNVILKVCVSGLM
jgi:hypothetical protein